MNRRELLKALAAVPLVGAAAIISESPVQLAAIDLHPSLMDAWGPDNGGCLLVESDAIDGPFVPVNGWPRLRYIRLEGRIRS